MTALSTIARDSALHCEAKKHGYRQTQDGVVVSFVLHPQEVPDALATASLGTRYVLALVEIGDDEKPKANGSATALVQPSREAAAGATGPASRSFNELPMPQQAGILCNEVAFHKYLGEFHSQDWRDFASMPDQVQAATFCVRRLCGGIASRRELLPDTPEGEKWKELVGLYRAWFREPEYVA